MLRKVREQKEQAITARHAADRERDEHISKYEEKCREMERLKESTASQYHTLARDEGRAVAGSGVEWGVSDGAENGHCDPVQSSHSYPDPIARSIFNLSQTNPGIFLAAPQLA
jgi:hypothetical protein